MMTAVNGYIDGNRVVVEENLSDWQGRNVVVTILDSEYDNQGLSQKSISCDEDGKAAALGLAGLWSDRDGLRSVEDVVRTMRRGRCFDI